MMSLTASMENYLKAICILKRNCETVRCVDIAHKMGVSLPSVSRAVKELSKMKHLTRESDGSISLTSSGERIAEEICERHTFFTEKLIDAGVDPATASKEACRIEHSVSEESFRKLRNAIKR